MPAVFESVLNGILVFRVTGSLHVHEFEAALQAGEEQIQKSGQIRFLVIYDGFEGWDHDFVDEDLDSKLEGDEDENVDKIAVLGEERWRESTELFLLKGLRKAAVEYFEPGQEALARAWLES
jgi:hypothetical protein